MGGGRDGEGGLGAVRLTAVEVREMRVLRALGLFSFAALGELYGVSASTAERVARGRTYRGVGGPVEPLGVVCWTRRRRPAHGEASMYAAGCRCDSCSEANRRRCREWRGRRGSGSGRGVHGDA
jgi:hypothetical protein